jgi:hypothetical protein
MDEPLNQDHDGSRLRFTIFCSHKPTVASQRTNTTTPNRGPDRTGPRRPRTSERYAPEGSWSSGVHEPATNREPNGLAQAPEVHFVHDVMAVALDRSPGYSECRCDFVVTSSVCQTPHDLAFTRGEEQVGHFGLSRRTAPNSIAGLGL